VSYYSYTGIRLAANFITTLTVVTLLFLPVYVLYRVKLNLPKTEQGGNTNSDLLIGLIFLFTLFFAGSLYFMTNARRFETFGVCAAYTAVLVVFLSGDI
jgi:hypothetical protein